MANLAQTINVLQALILTNAEKIILTPTYHVFEMYKVHQDATLLPLDLQCSQYEFAGNSIPALSVSASRDKAGKIHISLCNLDPNNPAEIACELRGYKVKSVAGRLLTSSKMTIHNTFDSPETLKPTIFNAVQLKNNNVLTTLPPKSVVVLEIR